MRPRTPLLPLLSLLATAGTALASAPAGFGLEVLVDGTARLEYQARGTVYVEALRGRDFSLRITNPLGVRVAVALSVDGLDTIDARHTTARDARKWVLDPYQTVVIPGWQVSGDTSRKFYFTGEKRSYGAALGPDREPRDDRGGVLPGKAAVPIGALERGEREGRREDLFE